jgi:hypothetical protein
LADATLWLLHVQGLFKGYAPESKEAAQAADTYLIINATCIELLNVREYVNALAPQGSWGPCGHMAHHFRVLHLEAVLLTPSLS